jgi:hypothetical protein
MFSGVVAHDSGACTTKEDAAITVVLRLLTVGWTHPLMHCKGGIAAGMAAILT